jgi:hypothetical protein
MTFATICWAISTFLCAGSVLGMLSIYKSMEKSMAVLTSILHEVIIKQGEFKYDARIPSMAEDTEVAE